MVVMGWVAGLIDMEDEGHRDMMPPHCADYETPAATDTSGGWPRGSACYELHRQVNVSR